MSKILYVFSLSKEFFRVVYRIFKGEFKAIPIDTVNIDYLYHVVNKEDINDIISDGYISISVYSSDIFSGINSKVFYAFKEFPTKERIALSKGDFSDEKVILKIKYDKEKYKDVYIRKYDEAILIPISEDKFFLNDLEYSVETLWLNNIIDICKQKCYN